MYLRYALNQLYTSPSIGLYSHEMKTVSPAGPFEKINPFHKSSCDARFLKRNVDGSHKDGRNSLGREVRNVDLRTLNKRLCRL